MIAADPLLTETMIPLQRAATLLEKSLNDLIRWSKRGLNGVRLEAVYNRDIGTTVTSVEAIGRFLVKVGVKSL